MNTQEILQDEQAIKREIPDVLEITPLPDFGEHYYEIKYSPIQTPVEGQVIDSSVIVVNSDGTIVWLPQ